MSCTIGMKWIGSAPAHDERWMAALGTRTRMTAAGRVQLATGNPGKTPGQAEGDRETADENLDRGSDRKGDDRARGGNRDADPGRGRTPRHEGAGITDLPPEAEEGQQESLPPRGSRKQSHHA
jgi:hypothetical protein